MSSLAANLASVSSASLSDALNDTLPRVLAGTMSKEEKARRKSFQIEYPKQLWYFLAVLLFTVALCQFISFLAVKISRRRLVPAATANASGGQADPETNGGAQVGPHVKKAVSLRRIPSAIVNAFRVLAFRCTIHMGSSYSLNLAEVTLTFMYIIALFTWTFINTTDWSGQKFNILYYANRSGTIANSQFPLITALGTKNNVISMITGVSYDKLNYLHRMTARVMFVLMWVHAIARIVRDPSDDLSTGWFRLGVLSTVAYVILCVVSLRSIRGKAYELFFYVHFATVLILLIGAYYHTREFEFDNYVWPSFIIWGLDRLIRLIRVLAFNRGYFNFFSRKGSSAGGLDKEARVELVSEHLVRLTMKRPSHFHWAAGQTGYLITPSVSTLPFEAHPFTIASYDSSKDVDSSHDSTSSKHTETSSADEKGTRTPVSAWDEGARSYWNDLVFLINVRKGYTKRLGKIAAEKGTVKAWIDGPYGPSPDLSLFDTSVVIAGGAGVSYTLPVFINALELVKKQKSQCKRIVFVWAIRDFSHLQWVSDALARAARLVPHGLDMEVRIFVTGADSSHEVIHWDDDSVHSESQDSPISEEGVKEKEPSVSSLLSLSSVSLIQGRPDLKELLSSEAEKTRGGRMSVSVCGSSSVAEGVRSALRFPISGPASVLSGGASVTLHVESFGYA